MPLNLSGHLEVEALVAHRALNGLGLQLARLRRLLLHPLPLRLRQLRLEPLLVGGHLAGRVRRHRHQLLLPAGRRPIVGGGILVVHGDEKVLALAADDAAALARPALALLALVRVEEGEVVVVGDLLAGQDVPLGKDGHPLEAVDVPLFHLAVRVARVVDKSKISNE